MTLKNKNRITAILTIAFLVSYSCSNYKKETKIFETYLNDNFNKSIEQHRHCYLLSNSYVCKNCISYYLAILDSSLMNASNKNITIITTLELPGLERLKSKTNFLKDNLGQLNYENLNLNNLTIFSTENGKIVDIIYLPLDKEKENRYELNQIARNN